MENAQVRCAECDSALNEPADLPLDDRTPCLNCGSTKRKFVIELRGSIRATSSVRAQVVSVGAAVERDTALPVTPVGGRPGSAHDLTELPTEVITEALQATVVILPPDPDEDRQEYVGEVRIWGHDIPLGVGGLPDVLLAVTEWLEELMNRWQEKRRQSD
jgi:hypothetical protein